MGRIGAPFAQKFLRNILAVEEDDIALVFLQFCDFRSKFPIGILALEVDSLDEGCFGSFFQGAESLNGVLAHDFIQIRLVHAKSTVASETETFGQQRNKAVFQIHALCQFHDLAA